MATTTVVKGEVIDDPVEIAHLVEKRVFAAIAQGKEAVWELAESLFEFDEAHGYKRLGHETLEEWLAQPEVGITKTTYYNLVGSWKKFAANRLVPVKKLKLLDPTKVAIVADAVSKAKMPVDEAVSDVETLGFRDLREKYALKPKPSKPKAEKKPPEAEDEDEPKAKPDSKPEGGSGRNDAPEYPQEHRAMTLGFLGDFARKRWHRKPTDAQVGQFLDEGGVAPLPDLPWELVEQAVASGAAMPRVPVNVLKALLAWRG